MAESLRRLVNIGSFTLLQEKLERWLDDYKLNTCDQNVSRCCEVIEINAKLQAQLFRLLSITASDGGVYGGAAVLKGRLLPWLSQAVVAAGGGLGDATLLAEVASKDRELNNIQDMYETSLNNIEDDLNNTKVEADELQNELSETRDELETLKRQSTSEKMFTEAEVRELRTKLTLAGDEISSLRNRTNLVDTYERQVSRLRNELALLSGRKEAILNGDVTPEYRSLSRPTSPYPYSDVSQRVRQDNLITRYNDMFSADRLNALDTLRLYSDDYENNQRIIFSVIQEAFTAARLAFSNFKMKVRSNLAVTHVGPETLEEAVQDYINRNTDLYDLPALVSDVVRALNRNVRIALPVDVTYRVIEPFIREACKLAWNMAALARPLDISVATEAELYDDNKYRRSFDSDYSAPLVNHHIWPSLVQGSKVIIKGECNTRRGASMNVTRRSRSRSLSPSRARSPARRAISPFPRPRSRSPSPRRLESSLSGRRSRSPSRASSRAVTASTSLSNYGVYS